MCSGTPALRPERGEGALGSHQGGGEAGETNRAQAWAASGASSGALAGVPLALPALFSRDEIARESRQGRVRLERCARGPRQTRRGDRRGRGGDRNGSEQTAVRRGRRPLVRGRQPGAPSQGRSREPRCAAPTPNSSAASRISNAAWRSDGQTPESASLDEMESLWAEAKARELGRADSRFPAVVRTRQAVTDGA